MTCKDWAKFRKEWRDDFTEYPKADGVRSEVREGDAHATGEAGTLLKVYVNDYRFAGIGSRVMFGVMTGNAYIDAKATAPQSVPEAAPLPHRYENRAPTTRGSLTVSRRSKLPVLL